MSGSRPSFSSIFWPTTFAVPAFVVLILLGNWQLARLDWKLGLIERIEAGLAADPVPLPPQEAWAAIEPKKLDYTHTFATGIFRHDLETHVNLPAVDGRNGYRIVTPLELAGGGYVLVDRGWVPLDAKEAEARQAGQVQGEQHISGILHIPDAPNSFTPDPDLKANMWFSREVAAIAEAKDLSPVFPLILEADDTPNPGGLPVGGQTRVVLNNPHLSYALTWYGLAATLVGVYAAFIISKFRAASRGEDGPAGGERR